MTPNASWDQCKALAEKHTDGPWEACAPGDYGDFDGESRVVCSADPDDMRRIAVVHWSERHPETDANAHLIAAAPELLEALVDVLDSVGALCNVSEFPNCLNLAEDRGREILAIIRKARGQS